MSEVGLDWIGLDRTDSIEVRQNSCWLDETKDGRRELTACQEAAKAGLEDIFEEKLHKREQILKKQSLCPSIRKISRKLSEHWMTDMGTGIKM